MGAILSTIQGNATADAGIKRFDDGGVRGGFTVAVNDTYYDPGAGEWKERKPEFVRVQIRRKSLAENVAQTVRKGQPVLVSGRLVSNTWTDSSNNERHELLIHAEHVGVELTYGTASYTKTYKGAVDENDGAPLDGASRDGVPLGVAGTAGRGEAADHAASALAPDSEGGEDGEVRYVNTVTGELADASPF